MADLTLDIPIILNPGREVYHQLLERPGQVNSEAVRTTVSSILEDVRTSGQQAVVKYNAAFGGYAGQEIFLVSNEIAERAALTEPALQQAINQAAANIRTFHQPQLKADEVIETMPGIRCWRKSVAIQRVGLYIPGGSAPLFSTVLMLGIPAQIAGCQEVILATPANAAGEIHPAICYAAQVAGIERILLAGGAQAIGALAYGIEGLAPVYKIFGPGNQYVTMAKTLVSQSGIAIDMPAGPSEVLVYADSGFDPTWAAADLLSQAEHGPDSQVILVTDNLEHASNVKAAITDLVQALGRSAIAVEALQHARIFVMDNQQEAIRLVNDYAAEHLIIARQDAEAVAAQITQAGSIFLGYHSPESVGDYASGTNHTLPTYGYARAYSGVSVDSFVKKITVQQLTETGLANISQTVVTMAEAEQLDAHALAVKVRLQPRA